MVKVSEEQIETLVRALQTADDASRTGVGRLVGEGESIGFYHGMISALVLSHQLVRAYSKDNKDDTAERCPLTEMISLAAARASQFYLDLKHTEDESFPDLIAFE